MKILFVGLATYYTEELNYQDNSFCKVFLDEGHDVTFISNPEMFVNGVKTEVPPCDVKLESGMRLIRVGYRYNKPFSKIFKIFKTILPYLEEIKPDIIYCHGHQYYNILEVVQYKNKNQNVKVYADTHTSYGNANLNKWYGNILYKLYYKQLYKKLEPCLEKYFYIGLGEKKFAEEIFGVNPDIMRFLPLGGFSISEEEYNRDRTQKRNKLNLSDNDILIVHSGKLDALKNTDWIINSVNKINNPKLKFVIIGNIPESNKKLEEQINKNRNANIQYLGWKSSQDLLKYICASDLYIQPGSPSVTFNNSLCLQTPIIAYKHDFYSNYYDINSICWIKNETDLENIINKVCSDRQFLTELKFNAKINKNILDYKTNLHKFIEF